MSSSGQTVAKNRIQNLLDDNSFVEIGAKVTKRNTDFNLGEKQVPADGVITGYGLINGSMVYVYSQDMTALGGAIGEMHAKKIAHIYDLAMKIGVPVIGLVDCAGLRLQEATDALDAFGNLYVKKVMASGVIPQITAVFGNCGGGVAVANALGDFTFMEADKAKVFVSTPNVLDGNYTEKCDTASAQYQASCGNVDFVCQESEISEQIRQLISIIPTNNEDDNSFEECADDLNRACVAFDGEVRDPRMALIDLSDNGFFMETKKEYAKEMVTGFIRLNGMTVGVVANAMSLTDEEGKEIEKFANVLTTDGCRKATGFVKVCDAFHIPILTLTNVKGYKTTVEEEKTIGRAVAELTYTFTNATSAKVNLIVGEAFGSAYVTMNSSHIGADMVFALPHAKIGMMDATQAVKIMYAEEINASNDVEAKILEKANEYEAMQSSVEIAASRGYVDNVIEGSSVRKQMIYAFEMLFTKRDDRPSKKHGTV
ncbi:MAG: carboxyl transferase [Lachnospiraceae bacterium]|nr:carboxyl transferase [Lachnospiraceae bacterium]